MSFFKKHWRWSVPLTVVVLCLSLGSVLVVRSNTSTSPEPKIIYTLPERTNDTRVNTGGIQPSTLPTTRPETQSQVAKVPVETSSNADSIQDLEPLEECCEDEVVLDTHPTIKLSKEEIERRTKSIKGFFDELDQEFANIDTNREALMDRKTELTNDYFEYIDAIVDLLSPEYQQRLQEVESFDEFTQSEIDDMNEQLEVIGEQLGVPDMHEYMHTNAVKFFEKFMSIDAAIDKLSERELELVEEMEDFTP